MQSMNQSELAETRCSLDPDSERFYRPALYPASPELAAFVEHYWAVEWDLRDVPPYVYETLPDPAMHIIFGPESAQVVGVTRGKFSYTLENRGFILGVHFWPGALPLFSGRSASDFTDQFTPLASVFGAEGAALEAAVLACRNDAERLPLVERFLCARLPKDDTGVRQVRAIIDRVIEDRAIRLVDDLADKVGLHPRTLQRLFNQYVGASPKWVIQRYRLYDAVEQSSAGTDVDWADVALVLGYFDQAHFIKDFKAMVGATPADYARKLRELV